MPSYRWTVSLLAIDGGTALTVIAAAIVAVVGSTVAPSVIGNRTAKAAAAERADAATKAKEEREFAAETRRLEREADWARQDAVAEKAAAATRELTESQARLLLSNEHVAHIAGATAELAGATSTKIGVLEEGQKVIHGLVNSQYTELLKAQLVTLRGSFVLIRRVIAQNETAGIEVTQEDRDTVAELTAQMTALQERVESRMESDRVSALQQATGTVPPIPLPAPDLPVVAVPVTPLPVPPDAARVADVAKASAQAVTAALATLKPTDDAAAAAAHAAAAAAPVADAPVQAQEYDVTVAPKPTP